VKYIRLLINTFRDTFADTTRVKVSSEEVASLCRDLSQNIQQTFSPDIVVAIDYGGSIPGELIGRNLSIPVAHLVIRRNTDIVRRYGKDPIPLRWIISFYHHYLFRTVTPYVSKVSEVDFAGKNILIVDDSIHTGTTLNVAVRYLCEHGANAIKSASLAHIEEIKPDFTILPQGNYSFPWSVDHKNQKK
jgi:hypoxanthine phosphoribosyltransferase